MRHSLILAASLAMVALPGCGDDGGSDSTTSTTTASTTTDPSTSGGSGSTTDDPTTSTSTTSGGSSSTTSGGSTGGGSTGGGSTGGGSTGGGSTGTTGGMAQFNPTDTKCDIFCGDYFAACTPAQGNDYGDEATCVGQCESWTTAQWDKREQSLELALAGETAANCVGASMLAQ